MAEVKVYKQPQGTVDVLIGQVHLKTFGGVRAEQAAQDWANLIRLELAKEPEVDGRSFSTGTTQVPVIKMDGGYDGQTENDSSVGWSGDRDSNGVRIGGEPSVTEEARGWLHGRKQKRQS